MLFRFISLIIWVDGDCWETVGAKNNLIKIMKKIEGKHGKLNNPKKDFFPTPTE